MSEMLQEYCDSRGVKMRVDRDRGILRGVKILGLKSRNGRSYLPGALEEAAALYENAKVNVNHPLGNPAAPRDYRDRLGQIRCVAMQPGEGLYGDLHFNPKHALAEQLLWDAQYAPENVGFSHNVEARTARRGDETVVEAITRVQSVDLVADPATTRGLFESLENAGAAAKTAEPAPCTIEEMEKFGRRFDEALEKMRAEFARLSEKLADQEARPRIPSEDRKPVSRDQNFASRATPASAKAFVEAIT
jgi:hypothetical protein